jgi:hypothetical protein
MNNRLVLISGKSTTGKSASLRNIREPEKVLYLNYESGKDLPFPDKFRKVNITDPLQTTSLFASAEASGDKCDTIILDSQTYMMDQYESIHVLPAANTMQAWGEFAQFFKTLMQKTVAESTKNVIMTAHTLTTLNEADGFMETAVPVKGSLKNNGIESYFSCVISTKKMSIDELDGYESDLLNITEEEKAIGVKYVFQTKLTRATRNERIRSPMGMWSTKETYIDNDIQIVLDRLDEYYG